jgi:hypothetical protein
MNSNSIKVIRGWIAFFMIALFLSGITAIPINNELEFLLRCNLPLSVQWWLKKVLNSYNIVETNYPFLLYGYDWLAFAHIILAILFIGPYRDPIRNIWVIQFGLIACLLIFPLAFIAGSIRGIPIGWQFIDCSFGLVGCIPLLIIYKKTQKLNNHLNTKIKTYEY